MNINSPVDKQSPEYQKNLVKSARTTLLVAVLFTVLNVVLLIIGSNRYFLYSATIPYYLTFFGYVFDHMMVGTYTLTGLSMAVVPIAALALCWFMSKKDDRWLTAATVVFGLDTAAMLGLLLWAGDLSGSLLDIVFHGWVLICLIRGVKACKWLRNVPAEPVMNEEIDQEEVIREAEDIPTNV